MPIVCKIFLGLVLALLMAIMQSALFPALHLFAFGPFLALLCLYSSFKSALWWAAFSGCFQDFFVSDPSGIHALHHTVLCAIAHRWQRNFKEHPLQLPLFSALISTISFPLKRVILFLFEGRVQGGFSLIDFLQGPFVDASYAFFWFVGPLVIWDWIENQWKIWRLKQTAQEE